MVAKEFYGTTAATDHNLYVKGRYMYQSNYVAGLRVVDVKRPGQAGRGRVLRHGAVRRQRARLRGVVEQLSVLQERRRGGDAACGRGSSWFATSRAPSSRDRSRASALARVAPGGRPPHAARRSSTCPTRTTPPSRSSIPSTPAPAAHGGPPPLRRGRQRQAAPRAGGAGRERLVRHADRGGEGPQARPRTTGCWAAPRWRCRA